METAPSGLRLLVHERRPLSLVSMLFACGIFATPLVRAAGPPKIHTKKIKLLHGVVTGTRTVPAYASALGAAVNPVGELYCSGLDEEIKSSEIFRVEGTSHYFDLLKWCNGYGTPSSWGPWEQLQVGEAIVFRVVKEPVQLPIARCEDLGLLSKTQAQRALDPFSSRGQKIYRSHCTYSVLEAYMKVPDERWIFRIVDSGPHSKAKDRQIGASYSESLAPAW